MFGKTKIVFRVNGKLPQKSGWNDDDVSPIINLREAALEARNASGIDNAITKLVSLKLVIHAPNVNDKLESEFRADTSKEDRKYVGDLDTLVSGLCDYLSCAKETPGNNNFQINPMFKKESKIYPTEAILFEDDSQIQSIFAKKINSDETYYVVEIKII